MKFSQFLIQMRLLINSIFLMKPVHNNGKASITAKPKLFLNIQNSSICSIFRFIPFKPLHEMSQVSTKTKTFH